MKKLLFILFFLPVMVFGQQRLNVDTLIFHKYGNKVYKLVVHADTLFINKDTLFVQYTPGGGTVVSITAVDPLTGGTITHSGSIGLIPGSQGEALKWISGKWRAWPDSVGMSYDSLIKIITTYYDTSSGVVYCHDTAACTSLDPTCTGLVVKTADSLYWVHTPSYHDSTVCVTGNTYYSSNDSILANGIYWSVVTIASKTTTLTCYKVENRHYVESCKWLPLGSNPDPNSWTRYKGELFPTHFADKVKVQTMRTIGDGTIGGVLYASYIYDSSYVITASTSGVNSAVSYVSGQMGVAGMQSSASGYLDEIGAWAGLGIAPYIKYISPAVPSGIIYNFDTAFYPTNHTAYVGRSDHKFTNAYFSTLPTITNPGYAIVQNADGSLAKSTISTVVTPTTVIGVAPIVATTVTQTVTISVNPFSTTSTLKGVVPGSNNLGSMYYIDGSGNWSVPIGVASGTIVYTNGWGINLDPVTFAFSADTSKLVTFNDTLSGGTIATKYELKNFDSTWTDYYPVSKQISKRDTVGSNVFLLLSSSNFGSSGIMADSIYNSHSVYSTDRQARVEYIAGEGNVLQMTTYNDANNIALDNSAPYLTIRAGNLDKPRVTDSYNSDNSTEASKTTEVTGKVKYSDSKWDTNGFYLFGTGVKNIGRKGFPSDTTFVDHSIVNSVPVMMGKGDTTVVWNPLTGELQYKSTKPIPPVIHCDTFHVYCDTSHLTKSVVIDIPGLDTTIVIHYDSLYNCHDTVICDTVSPDFYSPWIRDSLTGHTFLKYNLDSVGIGTITPTTTLDVAGEVYNRKGAYTVGGSGEIMGHAYPDLVDVIMVYYMAKGLPPPGYAHYSDWKPLQLAKADINGDGKISMSDVMILSEYTFGSLSLDSLRTASKGVQGSNLFINRSGTVFLGDRNPFQSYSDKRIKVEVGGGMRIPKDDTLFFGGLYTYSNDSLVALFKARDNLLKTKGSLKVSDSLFLTLPTISPNGYAITQDIAGNLALEAITSGGGGITDITYSNLITAIKTHTLTKGGFYRIIDYRTKYQLEGVFDTIQQGGVEPLIVQALSTDSIDYHASSELFPQDIIYWNPSDSLTEWVSGSNNLPAESRTGKIYYRKDTKLNIETWYDWRNVKFRRWKSDLTGFSRWDSVAYNVGDVVRWYNDSLFYCKIKTLHSALNPIASTDTFQFITDNQRYLLWGVSNTIHIVSANISIPYIDTIYRDMYTFGDTLGNQRSDWFLNMSIGKDDYIIANTFYNNIVFSEIGSSGTFDIKFGNYNYSMTYGDYNSSMTYGDGNSSMTYGDYNSSMTYGNGNSSMTYGDGNSSMTYGNYNYFMTYGNNNYSMTYGDGNSSMTYGDGNSSMTYGNRNYFMTYGNNNYFMTYGNVNSSMTYGDNLQNKTYINGAGGITYIYGNIGDDVSPTDTIRANHYLGKSISPVVGTGDTVLVLNPLRGEFQYKISSGGGDTCLFRIAGTDKIEAKVDTVQIQNLKISDNSGGDIRFDDAGNYRILGGTSMGNVMHIQAGINPTHLSYIDLAPYASSYWLQNGTFKQSYISMDTSAIHFSNDGLSVRFSDKGFFPDQIPGYGELNIGQDTVPFDTAFFKHLQLQNLSGSGSALGIDGSGNVIKITGGGSCTPTTITAGGAGISVSGSPPSYIIYNTGITGLSTLIPITSSGGSNPTIGVNAFSTTSTTSGVVPGSNNLDNTYFLATDGWRVPAGTGSSTVQYWKRTGTTLSPATANDKVQVYTTGDIAGDFKSTRTTDPAIAVKGTADGSNSESNYAFWADAGSGTNNYSFYGTAGDMSNISTYSKMVGAINKALYIDNTGLIGTVTPTTHVHSWTDITSGVPTTKSGYGITDVFAKPDTNVNGFPVGYFTYTQGLAGKASTSQSFYIGTTSVAINRGSGALSLAGVNIDGSSALATQVTVTQNTTNAIYYPVFVANTGSQGALVSTSTLTYNPSKGQLTNNGVISPGIIADGTCSPTLTVDFSLGNTHTITRNGSTTITLSGGVSGTTYTLIMTHEASTTAYTVTFSPVPKYAGGTAPTWTNTSGAVDIIVLKYIGTTYYASQSADFK